MQNFYKFDERMRKQNIFDSYKVINGYLLILYDYCKLDLKEYIDIIRKWLRVKKRENIKGLLGQIELKLKSNEV
jgi:hypothetical protein